MDFREKYEDLDSQVENLHSKFLNNSPIIDMELLPLETGFDNAGILFYLKLDEKMLKSYDCNTRQI